MASLKRFIVEIHRRSLWQVLTVYLGASWAVLEVSDQIVARYLLPEWVYPAALILLLVGFPIVLATAFVREDLEVLKRAEAAARREPRESTPAEPAAAVVAPTREAPPVPHSVARLFTWPRAVLGGVLAFTVLGIVSAFIVLRGTARVTEAYGAAGDAFEERAWIVVADFAAPESEAELALAAQAALEVDLQQSQYINIRGRNQIRPVLRRMGLPDTTTVDERLALEVAEREGLPAVLAPAVSRLGSDYVFSARVVQAGTGEELIAVRAVAREGRLVEAVETLSREVRHRLGEAGDAIRRSKPLPEVTTRSLEALKFYAEGVSASRDQLYEWALEAAAEAVRLDSTFAMAHRLLSVANTALGRFSEGAASAERAYQLRDRLTDRERLHVEGFYYLNAELDHRRGAEVYELLLSRYPDDYRAAHNLGYVNSTWLGNYQQANTWFLRALELDPYSATGYGGAISTALYVDGFESADSLLTAAKARGIAPEGSDLRLAVAREDWERADALCDSLLSAAASPAQLVEGQTACGGLAAARGRLAQATDLLESAGVLYADRNSVVNHANVLAGLAAVDGWRGRPHAARSRLAAIPDRYRADSIGDVDRYVIRTNLVVAGGTLGDSELIDRLVDAYPRDLDPDIWLADYAVRLEEAARALSDGEPERAVTLLHGLREFGYKPAGWEYDRYLLLGLAFGELGQSDSAVANLELAFHPARFSSGSTWAIKGATTQLPFALRRLAELEESRGNTDAAIRQYQRLLELWSDADPELSDQVTSAQRALARLAVAES